MSVLLYSCTIWILTERLETKLDGTKPAVLNKSWKQHPTKQQLCGYLLLISQTIQLDEQDL